MGPRDRAIRQVSFRWAMAILVLLAIGAGCREVTEMTDPDLPPPTSGVLSSNQFDDIPVPLGFVLETKPVRPLSFNGSYIYQTAEYREGRLLYTGSDDPAKILDFYRSQMVLPVNGWRNVAEDATSDGGDLVFEKGASRSRLRVFRSGTSTYVMIEVSKANEG